MTAGRGGAGREQGRGSVRGVRSGPAARAITTRAARDDTSDPPRTRSPTQPHRAGPRREQLAHRECLSRRLCRSDCRPGRCWRWDSRGGERASPLCSVDQCRRCIRMGERDQSRSAPGRRPPIRAERVDGQNALVPAELRPAGWVVGIRRLVRWRVARFSPREHERVRDEREHFVDRALDTDAGLEGDHAVACSRAAAIGWRAVSRAAVSGSWAGR